VVLAQFEISKFKKARYEEAGIRCPAFRAPLELHSNPSDFSSWKQLSAIFNQPSATSRPGVSWYEQTAICYRAGHSILSR